MNLQRLEDLKQSHATKRAEAEAELWQMHNLAAGAMYLLLAQAFDLVRYLNDEASSASWVHERLSDIKSHLAQNHRWDDGDVRSLLDVQGYYPNEPTLPDEVLERWKGCGRMEAIRQAEMLHQEVHELNETIVNLHGQIRELRQQMDDLR